MCSSAAHSPELQTVNSPLTYATYLAHASLYIPTTIANASVCAAGKGKDSGKGKGKDSGKGGKGKH